MKSYIANVMHSLVNFVVFYNINDWKNHRPSITKISGVSVDTYSVCRTTRLLSTVTSALSTESEKDVCRHVDCSHIASLSSMINNNFTR